LTCGKKVWVRRI